MKNVFSTIYIKPNSISGEKIAVGLILLADSKVYFDYSPSKLKVASLLTSSDVIDHVTYELQLVKKNVQVANKEMKSKSLSDTTELFTADYLMYLHKHSVGLTVFDEPKPIAGEVGNEMFNELFGKIVAG